MSEIYNNSDYIELTIKCLFREKLVLQKALDLHVKPEDFGTINIYRAFVSVALEIGEAPVNSGLCLAHLTKSLKKYDILEADKPTVVAFWDFIYNNEPTNAEHIAGHLADFVKFRRYQSIRIEKIHTPEELVSEAHRIVEDISLKDNSGGIRTFDPFEELVTVQHKESLLTGFPAVDMVARGLNYQEMGMILGHSGSGKTAMAVYSAIQNAKQRRKVLYLSLEEPAENICSRVYSNVFRIPYTDLHKGSSVMQQDLREAFKHMNAIEKEGMKHLKIHDLRDATPVTAKFIANYLDKLYADTGYHPDLVYIDQMDYLTTNEKFDAEWQKYGKVAFEVDDLSNHLIGGEHMFSVWLLHQATGKMTRKFTNGEISGFKGIIKPTDMCLAIGRDSSQDSIVSIFSLKSRHAKNFQFDYFAELEFMNFEQQDRGAEDRVKEEDQDKRTKQVTSSFNNIPPKKARLLPEAGTGFHSKV
jgi:ABC-type dipeptide/oligopeptide/nickel transport system ATPase component